MINISPKKIKEKREKNFEIREASPQINNK